MVVRRGDGQRLPRGWPAWLGINATSDVEAVRGQILNGESIRALASVLESGLPAPAFRTSNCSRSRTCMPIALQRARSRPTPNSPRIASSSLRGPVERSQCESRTCQGHALRLKEGGPMVRTRRPVHILIRAGATSLTPDCVLRQAALDEEVLGYRGIMTVGVWPGEDPGDVWDTDDKLSTPAMSAGSLNGQPWRHTGSRW